MSEDLRRAVHAVTSALAALRADPRSARVRAAIEQAGAAVDALDHDLTVEVLSRLVASIEACHLAGVTRSPRLAVRTRSASVALRLDPHWTARATASSTQQ